MRQYVTPEEFNAHPIGVALGSANLVSGVLDKVLWRASGRADRFCRRKLGAPGTTSLSATVAAGATQVALASGLGIDAMPDTVLQIGSGSTLETVQLGGTISTSSTAPYPVTVALYPGTVTQFAHNAGEIAQAYYYEQLNVLGSATSKMDQYFDFTQAGQIAEAHAPRLGIGENVRVIFVRQMPILQLVALSVAYPWANVLDPATVSDLFVDFMEGWIRMPIGYFNPPDSVDHVTYSAGYLTVPDEVQQAVIYEAAAELSFGVNFLGASSFRRGDYNVDFLQRSRSAGKGGPESKVLFTQEAEYALERFKSATLV